MAPFRLPTMNIVKNKSPKSVFACHEYQWTKTFTLEKERYMTCKGETAA